MQVSSSECRASRCDELPRNWAGAKVALVIMQTSLLQAHKQAQRLADDADAARIKTVAGAGVIGALCSGGWSAGVRAFGLAARKQRVPVGNFVNGSTVFLLSYTWYLLFATYVFRLHPMPWCASPRLPMWPPEGSAPKAALALSAAGVASSRTSRAQPRRRRIASSSSRRFLSLLPVPSRSPSPPNGLFAHEPLWPQGLPSTWPRPPPKALSAGCETCPASPPSHRWRAAVSAGRQEPHLSRC